MDTPSLFNTEALHTITLYIYILYICVCVCVGVCDSHSTLGVPQVH